MTVDLAYRVESPRDDWESRVFTPQEFFTFVVTGVMTVNAAHLDPETGIMTSVGDPRRNGRAMGAER